MLEFSDLREDMRAYAWFFKYNVSIQSNRMITDNQEVLWIIFYKYEN